MNLRRIYFDRTDCGAEAFAPSTDGFVLALPGPAGRVLDQGDKYRLSVLIFLICIHQEVFLKVQKREVAGASLTWT